MHTASRRSVPDFRPKKSVKIHKSQSHAADLLVPPILLRALLGFRFEAPDHQNISKALPGHWHTLSISGRIPGQNVALILWSCVRGCEAIEKKVKIHKNQSRAADLLVPPVLLRACTRLRSPSSSEHFQGTARPHTLSISARIPGQTVALNFWVTVHERSKPRCVSLSAVPRNSGLPSRILWRRAHELF